LSRCDHWSFEGATFAPLPSPAPEIWVGGSSNRALRRALELGDAWHTSRGVEPERVREVKDEHPDLQIVARTQVRRAEEYLDAGVDGLLLSFESEDELRAAASRWR
jgi:alkanesulfonate monooxygenase SsuD/methylene tetrahydromethanopterin reductase-like flavin-dependent oxidoreductase (luciferase family)